MPIQAYAVAKKGARLEPFQYEPGDLGPHDIEISISHCGICRSDLAMITDEWHWTQYPFVPGHEIIGRVERKGSEILNLEVGQRVGVGWQRSACLQCETCIAGDDNLCPQSTATIIGHHGGFANRIITDGRFAFPIPDALSSAETAPLLCGGITVFSPLILNHVLPTMRTAVVGIGGLGHMAIQFFAAWGCEVVAISSSPDKEREAKRLGAHSFLQGTAENLQKAAGAFHFILSTVPRGIDAHQYLQMLRPNGRLHIAGVLDAPLSVQALDLIAGQKRIMGSPIGNRARIQQMLTFAARHGIKAQVEVSPLREINTAMDRLRAGKVRYRGVLEV
jgi:alcohol/geraniol dehydrogenase (NADP+)